MSHAMNSRLRRIERFLNPPVWVRPKPWLVLNAGEAAPDPLPEHFGGVVQIEVYDARKPSHDHNSDDPSV